MSLQVWLPLTKDLRQQGLSKVTVTNNGATFSSAGKLGGCYEFASGKRIQTTLPTSTNLKPKAISFACWMYVTSWNSSYDCFMSIADGTGWNQSRATLCRNNTASTLTWNIADGSNRAYVTTTSALPLNTWTHVAGTYDGTNLKIYINGVLNNTAASTLSINYAGTFNIGGWSGANYPFNGKLNDVRFYNHCLSPMEVKKISQGLILHYPLSDKFLENTTNLITSVTSGGQTTWANNVLTTSGTNADTYFTLNLSENIVNGTQYTISCDAENIPQGTCWTFPVGQQSNTSLLFQIYNGHNEYTFTANNISWGTNRCFMDDGGSPNSARSTGAQCKLYNFQLEKKDHATGFAGYGKTRTSNIVYDCSGFGNNGDISGALTVSNNISKYVVSTHIGSTSSKIHISNLSISGFNNSYSFAWWGKRTSNSPMFWGFSDGCRLNGMYTGTLWNTGDGSNNPIYKPGTTTTITAPSVNVWHHYVMTGDGTICKLYVDGVLYGQAKTYKAISGTSIWINGWDSSTSYCSDNTDISDFRIYATALSEDDVKSLYQNEAFIDSSGTIYGQIR